MGPQAVLAFINRNITSEEAHETWTERNRSEEAAVIPSKLLLLLSMIVPRIYAWGFVRRVVYPFDVVK
ncbi:hypothetical protein B0A48_18693 [Cryoendolithus antarcticus]|uniref:Uncharacterized protein n=1 Tax=Cryoendolithus antarcticus TaxID=1507870 RepID=A0A1V8S8Z4_9PEZI|nr:hypothetical protein B0A48_18693 [Cryoendolithus antarcticus]